MQARGVAEAIHDWAESAAGESVFAGFDRCAPEVAASVRSALSRPDRIETVERIEGLAKYWWDDLLKPGADVTSDDAVAFARFFSTVGFFHKYKPYGVKIASPFGYSLFDLYERQGFSFQMHVEPKYEGFHILRTKPEALIYVGSVPEWNAVGQRWAHGVWAGQDLPDPPAVWRPAVGDTTAIIETETVHSVLSCVLEEFAGCSVDAVERLYDPYPRTGLELPAEHTRARDLLLGSTVTLPTRILRRVASGWQVDAAAPGTSSQTLIDVKGELWGGRVVVDADAPLPLDGSDEDVSVVVPAAGDVVVVDIEGSALPVAVGDLVCLPPRVEARIRPAGSSAVVALHRVARTLVTTDWTR
jgi:hypothetical protein